RASACVSFAHGARGRQHDARRTGSDARLAGGAGQRGRPAGNGVVPPRRRQLRAVATLLRARAAGQPGRSHVAGLPRVYAGQARTDRRGHAMDESRGAGQLERLRAGRDAARHTAWRAPAVGPAPLIEFAGVGHTYQSLFGRSVRAVEDFTLSIGDSEVFGLAGPNGAGKSTLISLLLGYLEPTQGTIRVSGLRPRAFVERHGIGYLSELVAIPSRWKLEEALQRYAVLAGVPRSDTVTRAEHVIG